MRHKLYLLLSLFFLSNTLFAQDTLKDLTLEHLMPGGNSYIFPENRYGLSWWGDQCVQKEMDNLKLINTKNGKEKVLLTRTEVNQILSQQGVSELTTFYQAQLPWANQNRFYFEQGDEYILVDWEAKTASILHKTAPEAENNDFNPVSKNLAYTVGNNLWVNDKQVTDNPEGIVAGQTVHRSEFGIRKGTFWSSKGDLLAFYLKDETMVSQYPLVDITSRVASLENVRYPMAGMESHKVKVGIYNPANQKTVYLNTGDPTNRFFTNISWSPDDKSIYLIEVNRDQNQSKLCRYNSASGELEMVLYEESHPYYVEPQTPIVFLPWNSNQFVLQSQRDGFNHLYLMNAQGEIIKQLTSGHWLVQELVGFNPSRKEIILTATKQSPLQNNILALSVNSGKLREIDNLEGVHRPLLSGSGTYLIDSYSSPNLPRVVDIVNIDKETRINLLKAEDPYKEYKQPHIQVGTIKAADGQTDLYYRLVTPSKLDKDKKYPVIVYVYGGPHAQMINGGWNYGARGWDIYMANKGYIVFTLDNRGSANRGLEFEHCTFRELGIKEGEDQVEGIKFLSTLDYVDTDRIGVHGWSFGGHMTTALMLRYPQIFKVGVSGGAVMNWALYEIMYGERYMDTPQTNPEGYKKTDLTNYANLLEGRLLLIHDDHDTTCVPQHTLSFLKACINARTYPDLFIYPNHAHNVQGRDRVHLYEKITRYFEDFL